MGYTGGKTLNPTYKSIQDHTEALLIEYDPHIIGFEGLLQHWTRMHSPTNSKSKCQYRAAVWYLDDSQQSKAEDFLLALEKRVGQPVTSAVEPVTRFYGAEDYHQNFIANQRW